MTGELDLIFIADTRQSDLSAYFATLGALTPADSAEAPGSTALFDPLDEPLFQFQWHLLNTGQTGGPAGDRHQRRGRMGGLHRCRRHHRDLG